MVGAVAHECSPACSIWCISSTLRTGRIEHSSSGRSWSGGHMPLLTSGGACDGDGRELSREVDGGGPGQEAKCQGDKLRCRDLRCLQDSVRAIGQCPESHYHLSDP